MILGHTLEQKLAEQSALLKLGKAWMEGTGGIVLEARAGRGEVRWSVDQYVAQLHDIPLWEEVKPEVSEYARLIQKRGILEKDHKSKKARLLKHFPTLLEVVTHFLSQGYYSEGNGLQGSLSSALNLNSVLCNYIATGEGRFESAKGDCNKVYSAINNDRLTSEEVLQFTGLEQEWQVYEKSRGFSPQMKKKVQNTLTHFLSQRHYSNGHGSQGPLGSALKLNSVLKSYVADGEGKFEPGNGDCKKVCDAINRESLTSEEVLQFTGLEKEWQEYEKTRGFSPEMKRKVRNTIVHFLSPGHYSSGHNMQGPLGSALKLSSVLNSYVTDGEGRFESAKGDCNHIYKSINKKSITPKEVLQFSGLEQEWQDYQQTTAKHPFVFQPQRFEL